MEAVVAQLLGLIMMMEVGLVVVLPPPATLYRSWRVVLTTVSQSQWPMQLGALSTNPSSLLPVKNFKKTVRIFIIVFVNTIAKALPNVFLQDSRTILSDMFSPKTNSHIITYSCFTTLSSHHFQ